MRRIVYLLIALLALISCGKKEMVWEEPSVGMTTAPQVTIQKVVFSDDTTTVFMNPQIPSGKGVRVIHTFGAFGLASALLPGERLLCLKEDGVLDVGINNGDAENLQPLLHGRCAAGPEPVNTRSLLS